MLQKLANGKATLGQEREGRIGEVSRDRGVEIDASVLRQPHHGGGDDRLGDRCGVKKKVTLGGSDPFRQRAEMARGLAAVGIDGPGDERNALLAGERDELGRQFRSAVFGASSRLAQQQRRDRTDEQMDSHRVAPECAPSPDRWMRRAAIRFECVGAGRTPR